MVTASDYYIFVNDDYQQKLNDYFLELFHLSIQVSWTFVPATKPVSLFTLLSRLELRLELFDDDLDVVVVQ